VWSRCSGRLSDVSRERRRSAIERIHTLPLSTQTDALQLLETLGPRLLPHSDALPTFLHNYHVTRQQLYEADCADAAHSVLEAVVDRVLAARQGSRDAARVAQLVALATARLEEEEAMQTECATSATDTSAQEQPPLQPQQQQQQDSSSDELAGLSDQQLLSLCSDMAASDLSYRQCVEFVRRALLPRIERLDRPASRLVFSALAALFGSYAKPLLDALLVPLVAQCGSEQQGTAQLEVLTWAAKEALPRELLPELLQHIVAADWSSALCHVMREALAGKPALSDALVREMALGIERNSQRNAANAKFTALVFVLVTKYEQQIKPHAAVLQTALAKCTSPMTKAIQARVSKLLQQ